MTEPGRSLTATGTALAPLREANFWWYFLASGVNTAGTYMNTVALAFAVLAVDGSPSALGAVLAAHSIPLVVFMLAGGVIADRLGRTLTIQLSNIGAGLTQSVIAVLVISGHARLSLLIVLTAVNGVFAAANFPALASLIPQLVPQDQLQQANALLALQRNGLRVIAPAAAGLVVVAAGPGWALAADGLTYLVSATLLTRMRMPARPARGDSEPMLRELHAGWVYVRHTTWFWVLVLAFAVINALFVGAFQTLGPVLALRTPIGESGWGLIIAAESAGLLLTALVFLRVRLDRPLLWGMLAMSLAAVPMLTLGAAPHLPLMLVAAFVGGAGTEVFAIGWQLAMQEHVPGHMLSRAYSYDALGSFVAMPLGQLAAGPVSGVIGLQPAILTAGILLALACWLPLASRSVRDLRRVSKPVLSHDRA